MQETETTNPNSTTPSSNQKSSSSKWWLWLIPSLSVCFLLLCLVGGSGLVFYRMSGSSSEAGEAAVEATSAPQQIEDEEVAVISTATATSTPPSSLETPTPEASATAMPTTVPSPTPLPAFCLGPEPSTPPALAGPTFSSISFATAQDAKGWPLSPTLQFTTTITRVQAFFGYAGIENGVNWERVWSFGNQELTRGQGVWDAGPRGQLSLHVEAGEGGFVPGRYFLTLNVEGRTLISGTFLMVDPLTSTQRPVQVAYTTPLTDTSQLNLFNLENQQTQPFLSGAESPTWSPDGLKLMFYSPVGVDGGSRGVWVQDFGQRKIEPAIPEPFSNPIAWSADGVHVATAVTKEDKSNLVLWNLHTRQAYNGPLGEDPAWAPEGRRLAYRSCSEAGWNISTLEIIGGYFDLESVQPLTSGDDGQPSWSWDGQQIAFVRTEEGNQDIYVMAVDGSNLTRLTEDPAIDTSPAWTPEGELMFRSLREGQWGLYMMEVDGSEQRRLLELSSEMEWQPDPLAISTNIQAIEPTPTPKPQPSVQVPPGQGILVVSNAGNRDEMTFTINNKEHKVPPYGYRNVPLPPGRYTWTASWPAQVSRTGIADIVIGQVSYPVVER
jgi:hypothetical protein